MRERKVALPLYPQFSTTTTRSVVDAIDAHGGDVWGEHPDYPKEDWQYEAANGDTVLGYWEWAYNKAQEAEDE